MIGIIIFGLPCLSEFYRTICLPYILPIGFGVGHIGRVGSVFVTMSVTIERYFAIVHPLRHFSGKRFLLIVPIVSAILYNIPKFFELERNEVRSFLISQVCFSEIYVNITRDSCLIISSRNGNVHEDLFSDH